MTAPAIEVRQLTRSFRTYRRQPGLRGAIRGLWHRDLSVVEAVRDITFDVAEGEMVGFLGPNGAGKTTTLKMLAGLLYPTSGTARVLGHVPWDRRDAYRRQFALLLGQKNQLWWDLPARESLRLNSHIYGLDPARATRTVDDLTTLLSVRDKLDVPVRELSLGERMKMELVAALLHEPHVLFLDEPTIGLDVLSQETVRNFLRDHNARRRTTIVLTSHYMADIQALCRRVIIIDQGSLFFDGSLAEVVDRFADFKLLTLRTAPGALPAEPDLSRYGEVVDKTPVEYRLKVKRDQVVAVCKALLDEIPIADIDISEVPIEDVIRRVFARDPVPNAAPNPAGVLEGSNSP